MTSGHAGPALAGILCACLVAMLPALARAQVPAPVADATAPASPAGLAGWASTIKLNAQIDAGVSFNPAAPKTNFGQLFTDHPNEVQLNQVLLTAARVIDPKQTGWDVGFKLQFMYGSDARYTHYLGVFDWVTRDRYQFDLVEANITVHAPVLTEGGIDTKIGAFPSPMGFETIDPSTNPFYSHSYIFNFGVPFKQTGAYAVVHATTMIDAYVGIDTGVNTTFSYPNGDNNTAVAGMFGFGLTLLEAN